MARSLKVFRTPIGFHDAYVAAPSQKAALEAWGSDANLFARGVAEVVTDAQLAAEPLANPGKVIKRLRGSAEDHFEALPKSPRPRAKTTGRTSGTAKPKPAVIRKVMPKPSRRALYDAEQRLDEMRDAHAAEEDELKQREDALRAERKRLENTQSREANRQEAQVAKARARYDDALATWRDQ